MKSWKTTLIGLLLALLGVIQASKDSNIIEIIKDTKVQLALLGAALGFFAKDHDVHGVG